MILSNLENRMTGGYATFGSVWGKGEVSKKTFALRNERNIFVPVQTRVTAWWPDGSVKWAAHTADSELMGQTITLDAGIEEDEIALSKSISMEEDLNYYYVKADKLSLRIPRSKGQLADAIAEDIYLEDKLIVKKAYPILYLERRKETDGYIAASTDIVNLRAEIHSVELEENGPLQCVFNFKGIHANNKEKSRQMPFIIRMFINADSNELRFIHTFFYDGKEEENYLKGMGIRFEAALSGRPYNRHVKFGTDRNCFHEAAVLLNSNYPRLAPSVLENQMEGALCSYSEESDVETAVKNLPLWDRYSMCQDSPTHFIIKKQTKNICCPLHSLHGYRAPGTMAVNGDNGGLIIGIKDFWRKYPSGIEVTGLGKELTSCTAWFYSPEVEAYDFRHYSTESYQMTSYEGFPEVGASAYGISVTSECTLAFVSSVPSDKYLEDFGERVQKPAVYVGTPEYYHEKRAFGYWSLKETNTSVEIWLEVQMETIFNFYKEEIDNRSWYGLFDYGDFMHTYDKIRHCWRYDMGGFAWQNTELVPTYWLWLYFLRTGREDVYTIAEAMSRHCSEVDFYHFGPMKGIGSRHNVRHWGCSCKEPRVSMAGHHRFYYYLTGDYRMGDVLKDVKDADYSLINLPHFRKEDDQEKVIVRSGPDWAAFVSNWMTEYERTLDEEYKMKIETGIKDFYNTPLRLASGPEYEYDAKNAHLIYQGEIDKSCNMHLQICMGGPEIWMEAADYLENDIFKDMLAVHGRFYYLSQEEKAAESEGLIVNRPFGFNYFAAALAAYSAWRRKDEKLALSVWKELLHALITDENTVGFQPVTYTIKNDGKALKEIPWIKTNFSAQWCLNIIVTLEFIREYLPDTMDGIIEILHGMEEGNFQKS